jgi:hypothetical protein
MQISKRAPTLAILFTGLPYLPAARSFPITPIHSVETYYRLDTMNEKEVWLQSFRGGT